MTYFLLFLATFFIAVLLFPLNILLAKKIGAVDDPQKRNHPAILHKKVTPRAGGVAIFISFVVVSILFVGFSKQIAGIFLGGALLVLVGVLDDIYDLKTKYKFAVQLLAAIVVVASGIGISYITNPLFFFIHAPNISSVVRLDQSRFVFEFLGSHSIIVLADLFALFWIVWVINMVNFSAGVDGQLGGIAFITLLVIFVVSLRFSFSDPAQVIVSKLAICGMGAILGFLIFNFYPARIFPGDSASYFLGFLIAVLSIISGAKVGAAILVMAIPLIDGAFTVLRRIGEGKSPFLGDRKHLHHRLLELGWSTRQVALFYWLLCAILGAAALTLSADQKLYAGIIAAIIILGGLLWLNMNLQIGDRK